MSRPSIQVSFDPKARAAYVRLSNSAVAETVVAADGLLLDLDHHGTVVGIEFLTASTLQLPLQSREPRNEALRFAEHRPCPGGEDRAVVRDERLDLQPH